MHSPASAEETFFAAALALPAAERSTFLIEACGRDPVLLARVVALLRSEEAAQSFLEEPPEKMLSVAIQRQAAQLQEAAVNDHIGRYKLRQKIGEGGCGVVFVAEQQEPVRRHVALKILKLGMDTREIIGRFEAERQAIAMMDHPNIARVFDAGATESGRPYFVMELVRGLPITRFCDQENLSTEARLELFTQVCRAVEHAHQKGVVHRDLKPSNILVTLQDGVAVPKVIDFGIAKATQGRLTDRTVYTAFEQLIGTPAYMSPEQAEMSGREIDPRSDIYSLGVLLYELLTGATPLDPKTLVTAGLDEIRRVIREIEPPRPSVRLTNLGADDRSSVAKQRGTAPTALTARLRGDLDWIVMRCLEKQRARRYERATDLALDVQHHLRDEPVTARPPSAGYRLGRFVRRRKGLLLAGTAVVLTAVASVSTVGGLEARALALQRECHLFRIDIDPESGKATTALAQITSKSVERRDPPSISPDGQQIAVWGQLGSREGLILMDSHGRSPRLALASPARGQIAWLNRDEVVFQELSTNSELTQLLRLDLKTGQTRVFARADFRPSGFDWQIVPAREEVVYVGRATVGEHAVFKAHSLATGTTREIAKAEGLTGFRYCFRVSPDGRSLAYGVWVPRGGGRAAELRQVSIDGEPLPALIPAPHFAHEGWRPSGIPYAWSPNGKYILYDPYPGGIGVLEIATGKTWPVPGAQDKAPHEFGLADWSPTGTFLVINRYRVN